MSIKQKLIDAAVERFEERAAIAEFCGGMPRDEAEKLAIGEASSEPAWLQQVLRKRLEAK